MFKKFNFKKECIHCVPDKSLIGKRVLCGDTYKEIIEQVESDNWKSCREILVEIDENKAFCPFGTKDDGTYRVHYRPFVYYDPEWDEETVYYCYLDRDINPIQFMFDHEKPSSHIYVEFTDVSLANSWCEAHDKFAKIAKAWEDGKTIQFYGENYKEWKDCDDPFWDIDTQYRVKPDEEIYDVYITTCFQHTPEFMIFKHSMAVHRGGIRYYKGTKSECENWIESHKKFKDLMYAWEYEDKTIQYYNSEKGWHDCADNNPFWDLNINYRIKPDEPVEVETSEGKMYLANGAEIPKKRRMTNRELAKWLAQGKGQWKGEVTCAVKISYSYIYGTDDIKIPDNIMIRGWNEEEWHEPEVEVSV